MDKRHNVKLITTTSFDLEKSEIKQLYIYLSLFQYRFMRTPNYPERRLIELLEKDFRKFYLELLHQTEKDANNLMLTRIKTFFELHHHKLSEIVKEYKNQGKE
ncbi:MAG: hypothetical protein SNJ33_06845 [Rikenellaceae bacterium]